MSIKDRLERVNYQFLKDSVNNPQKTWNDQEIVDKIRSIYDAAIDAEVEPDIVSAVLPTEVFGAQVNWLDNNTTIVARKGTASVSDDLIDDYVETVEDTTKFLEVGAEHLILSGSTYDNEFFQLSIDITDSNDVFNDIDTSIGEYVTSNWNNASYSNNNIIFNVDDDALQGTSLTIPLPTIHDKSSIVMSWSGSEVDTTSNIIAVDYSGEPFGSHFTVEPASNGSMAYQNTSVAKSESATLTLTFLIDTTEYTRNYNISFI